MSRPKTVFVILGLLILSATACIPQPPELPSSMPTQGQPVLVTSQATTIANQADHPPTLTASPEAPFEPEPGEATSPSIPTLTITPTQESHVAEAVQLPAPQAYAWSLVVNRLARPVGVASAADGSGRLFLLEQAGKVRVFRLGTLLDEPYLDISSQVSCCAERGLLGLAFHPRYAENGFLYINYTNLDGDTVIARFQVASDTPDRAEAASEKRLLVVSQPYPNHNGGGLAFGPDGYLYIGLGDGGSANDPQGNGQNTNTLLGKLLRIDVDGGEQNGAPYAIPDDNPFAHNGGGLPEVWAYGLRNPWRFTFDRQTGDLFIGDVGQNAWEEIDFLPAGSSGGVNFGWNYREGRHHLQGNPPQTLELLEPVAEYGHDQGCSVTGGVVYRGAQLPAWRGVYVYGDYCSGRVWGLLRGRDGTWQHGLMFETGFNIAAFGEDEAGEIYLTDLSGAVYQLVSNE